MFPLSFLPIAISQVQAQGLAPALPPQAEALLKAKDWPALIDWFDAAPPVTRGNHYELWLQCLNRSQRWDRLLEISEALQPLLEAKSGPKLGTYRLYRAQALSQLGRHQEAAQIHSENGRLGYSEGYANACAEARLAQDWNTLLTGSEELLKKDPDHAHALAWKGEAMARLERFDEAEPILRSALAKDATLAYAWNNLGRCLNERKAWAETCECLDHALALDPNQLEALFNRGRARFELKQYKASLDDFRLALALRPGDPVLTENLRQAERYAAPPIKTPTPKKR